VISEPLFLMLPRTLELRKPWRAEGTTFVVIFLL
jgi:hypothetical protein